MDTFAPTHIDSAAARRKDREQTIAAYWKKKQEAKEAIAQHKPATGEMEQAGIGFARYFIWLEWLLKKQNKV